jgi:hypothetical protein
MQVFLQEMYSVNLILMSVCVCVCVSGLENREYGRGDPLRWPRSILYPQKLALTSPTYGGRSVGIVSLRTKATEFVFCVCLSTWPFVEVSLFSKLIFNNTFFINNLFFLDIAGHSGRAV